MPTPFEQALAALAAHSPNLLASPDTPRIGPMRGPYGDTPLSDVAVEHFMQGPDDSGQLDALRAKASQYQTARGEQGPSMRAPSVGDQLFGAMYDTSPMRMIESITSSPAFQRVLGTTTTAMDALKANPSAYEQQFGIKYGDPGNPGKGIKGAIAADEAAALAGAKAVGGSATEAATPTVLSQAAHSKAIKAFRATLSPEEQAALKAEVETAFPMYDKYKKPNLQVLPRTLLAKAATLSPQTQGFINTVVAGLDPQHTISPEELSALATGTRYEPTRVVRPALRRTYNYGKTLEGAPLGVTNATDEARAEDDYMQLATQGIPGRLWYDKGGLAMLFHVGDNPEAAREFAALHSITSPNTDFGVNSGFAIKGHNQRIAGDPIQTGQYPAAMSKEIDKVYGGTSDILANLKRGPFFDALSRRGGFGTATTPLRPTNDIWQAEAWGYAHRDGTPIRKGFGPKQHAWMDRMTQAAVDRANAEALGGYTDWTADRLQAAAWFGARQRAALQLGERVPPYADFATGLERNYAQGSRESLPSPSTGHLGAGLEHGITAPENEAWRQVLDQGTYDITHDAEGRDKIAKGLGLLTGPSVRGPGAYEGTVAPGVQTQVSLGTQKFPVPDTKGEYTTLDASSEKNLRAAESAYALNFGQGAAGGGRFFGRDFSPVAVRNALQVTLGRVPTQDEFSQVIALLAQAGVGGDVAEIFKPGGYVMKDIGAQGTLRPNVEQAMRQAATTVHGADVAIEPGRYAGIMSHPAEGEPEGILLNDWSQPGQQFGQRYYAPLEPYREPFDQTMPDIARDSLRFDRILHEASGGKFEAAPNLTEVRQVMANEGYAGLERLARKWGISAVLLATAAGLASQGNDAQAQ
jgi:hypothetical protein